MAGLDDEMKKLQLKMQELMKHKQIIKLNKKVVIFISDKTFTTSSKTLSNPKYGKTLFFNDLKDKMNDNDDESKNNSDNNDLSMVVYS